jgi:SAM-dependent methyltransferase
MKEVVRYVTSYHGYSERRACALTRQHRATQRKPLRRDPCTALRLRMREIIHTRIRYGYRRVLTMLRREGWAIGEKLIYRLYPEIEATVRLTLRVGNTGAPMIPFNLHRRIPFVRWPFYQNTYPFQGYNIPIDLMMMTGGGPDTFDQISAAHISNLQKHVVLEPQFTIFELGCGIGRDAIPLTKILSAEYGGNYIGVDIIRPSIEWCVNNIQAKNPNFIFYHMNIGDQLHNPNGTAKARSSHLPVPDHHVDRVILQSVFTHMLRDDVEHYLREIKRVMKPEATTYITAFIYDDPILLKARETNLTPFDLRFEHEAGTGCRINDPIHPTGAVAYTRETIDEILLTCGLRHRRPPLKGSWSGFYPDPDDGQDVLILCAAD